ncbi:MAG: PIN domain-containing protein [Gemmatimonadota bacterium]
MSEAKRLRDALRGRTLVHVDASVLALHASAQAGALPLTRALFGALAAGELRAQTSALSFYQILAEAYRRGDAGTAERAERLLGSIPGLAIVAVTPRIARQAAQVRAQLGGGPERAIQLATALSEDADLFLTQRSALRRVAGMAVESLEALRPDGPGAG